MVLARTWHMATFAKTKKFRLGKVAIVKTTNAIL